jgi:Ca2+-binding RTX toxin-like protein
VTYKLNKWSNKMAVITGNDSDNSLIGGAAADKIRGLAGNDTLQGRGGADLILGAKDDEVAFGGNGADTLSGDDILALGDGTEIGVDVLIGGAGTDLLIGWGDDILVGSGPNILNAAFVENLKNDPFETAIAGDGVQDTFVAVNKQGSGYTLTVTGYEVGVDLIDLSAFGVSGASDFIEIQNKGSFFESKTPTIDGAELVLRINADPNTLTYL